MIMGVGGWVYVAQQRAARQAATARVVTQALDKATLLRGQAKAAPDGDLSKWSEALAAANQASSSLDAGEPTKDLRARVVELLATIEHEQVDAADRAKEAERDRRFLESLEFIRNSTAVNSTNAELRFSLEGKIDSDYSTAFREFGIDPDRLNPEEAGQLLKKRSRPLEIALYLDDWALNRWNARDDKHRAPLRRLIDTAAAMDPDPWRNQLRKLMAGGSPEAIRSLATDPGTLRVAVGHEPLCVGNGTPRFLA